jgi:DNA-binding response OmpR family regulator
MNHPTSEAIHEDPDVYDDGRLRIEHNSYYVTFEGRVLFLPPKEFLILSCLSRAIGRMVPSEKLWRYVWNEEEEFNPAALRVHICNLRRKITPLGLNIKSVASLGYCLFWIRQQIQPESSSSSRREKPEASKQRHYAPDP